jgi:hypothetical protein
MFQINLCPALNVISRAKLNKRNLFEMIQTPVDAYRLLVDVPGEIDRRLTLLRRTVHRQRLPYTVPEHNEPFIY